MKTILTLPDFSAISMNTVDYIAGLTCVIGTILSLIHMCAIPIATSEVPVPAHRIAELVVGAEEQIKLLKEEIMYRTRVTGAFKRFLPGGKTISAMRQLSWPLIVLPPDVKFVGFRKIGLACDLKNITELWPGTRH